MKKRQYKKKKNQEAIVLCCVERLLEQARENYKIHPERTKRYLSLILKFIQRYKLRLAREKRLKFCKKCLTYWVEGETLRITPAKSNSKLREYECMKCGYRKRAP